MGTGVPQFAGGELPSARRHPDSRARHDCWGRLALPARRGTRTTTGPARQPLPDAVVYIVASSLFLRNADAPRRPGSRLCVAAQSVRTPLVPAVSPPIA